MTAIMDLQVKVSSIIIILSLLLCVCASVRPERITRSNLTPVKKLAFFASLSFDVTEAVDRKS